jgi:predicted transposase YbfD/YdcC
MFFFFKYVKDLHIIVLKKKNVTIQTMCFQRVLKEFIQP